MSVLFPDFNRRERKERREEPPNICKSGAVFNAELGVRGAKQIF
jgi:hypothetical protein